MAAARDGETKGKGKEKEKPDGELTPDELAARRAARANGENGNGSASIAARARDGEELAEGEQGEAFPMGTLEGDPKVTHKTYIPPGSSVSTAVSMSRAEVPNPGGGLFRAGQEVQVLVRVLPQAMKETPINVKQADGTYKVKEWKVSQELSVIHVQHADRMFSEEQVAELLEAADVPAAQIAKLLGHEASTASAQG